MKTKSGLAFEFVSTNNQEILCLDSFIKSL